MKLDDFFSIPNVAFFVVLTIVIALQGHFIGDSWHERRRWWLGYITLFGGTGLMIILSDWDRFVVVALAISVAASRALFEATIFRGVWRTIDRENGRWVTEYFAGYLIVLFFVIGSDIDLITWGLMMASLGIAGAVKTAREMIWQSARSSMLRRQGAADGRRRE